jgi:hypothetical protein
MKQRVRGEAVMLVEAADVFDVAAATAAAAADPTRRLPVGDVGMAQHGQAAA